MKPSEKFVTPENNPSPRPISQRECQCGCGHIFQPNSTRHVYLNKQHGDFGYNNGPRKIINAKKNEVEKILRKNDRILAKHYKSMKGNEAVCFLIILKADGFDPFFNIGTNVIDGMTFFFTYNYMYHLYKNEGHKLIKIRKI